MREFDLLLIRKWFTIKSTISELHWVDLDGKLNFLCYILEDEARPTDVKIPGSTCIPAGDYQIRKTMSSRFRKILPLIYNVEAYQVAGGAKKPWVVTSGRHIYEGIRIHAGNTIENTEGCQLPGTEKGKDIVLNSRDAFWQVEVVIDRLMKELKTDVLKYRIIHNQAA